jgi:hypothetical protein
LFNFIVEIKLLSFDQVEETFHEFLFFLITIHTISHTAVHEIVNGKLRDGYLNKPWFLDVNQLSPKGKRFVLQISLQEERFGAIY